MSTHRAAVPHVCQRYARTRRRRLMVERVAPVVLGVVLVVLGALLALAALVGRIVAP